MNDRIDRLAEEARQLTDEERVELMDRLWNLIPEDTDALPIPDWHRTELDQRVADFEDNSQKAIPWDDVKSRLLARTPT